MIHYISSRSIKAFRNKLPLSGQTGQGVNLSNNYLTVQHSVWKNAVAYETFNANNQLIYVSVMGTGDTSNQTTKVYYPSNATAVYAVGYDGRKILVYPVSTLSVAEVKNSNSELIVYPNPVEQNGSIHIKLKNASGNYNINILGTDGKIIFSSKGNLDAIEKEINTEILKYPSGIYLLSLKDAKGKTFKTVKVIKR
ncbi:MAG: T9SS type A sorting domain-containing protein [Chryseobacterium sp.]|nr:T9SS type A sorting domain-containing protein [Chryseobacterium sp.]